MEMGEGGGKRRGRMRVNIILSSTQQAQVSGSQTVQLLSVRERIQTWTCLNAAAHTVTARANAHLGVLGRGQTRHVAGPSGRLVFQNSVWSGDVFL